MPASRAGADATKELSKVCIDGSTRGFSSVPFFRSVLGCARLCQVVPGCARLCQVVPGCARLCQVVPSCARLYKVVPGCARLRQVAPSFGWCHVEKWNMCSSFKSTDGCRCSWLVRLSEPCTLPPRAGMPTCSTPLSTLAGRVRSCSGPMPASKTTCWCYKEGRSQNKCIHCCLTRVFLGKDFLFSTCCGYISIQPTCHKKLEYNFALASLVKTFYLCIPPLIWVSSSPTDDAKT